MGCMDEPIETTLPDLTGMTMLDLLNAPPAVRERLDAAAARLVEQLRRDQLDDRCC